MKNFLALICACSLLLSACNEKTTAANDIPEFSLNETFDIAIGNTMKLKGEKFTIKFTEITEDSRCPEGVNCIRAGVVKFVLQSGQETKVITKQAKKELKTTFANYNLLVSEVTPYPKNGQPMDKTAYSVKMRIN